MFEFIKRRLSSQKGAMDKILVTLLLVIVGVGAVVGLSTWLDTESGKIQSSATEAISSASKSAANP